MTHDSTPVNQLLDCLRAGPRDDPSTPSQRSSWRSAWSPRAPLDAIGSAQPVDFIIGAILDPQKEIKEGYISISVTTKDGEEYQGYQLRETGEELVLRDVLQNKEIRLRRDTIQEKKQTGSVMPNGLTDMLTRTEFRDLVRFLSELGLAK